MTHNASLDQTPSDTLKLLRLLDVLAIVLAFGYFALVFLGQTPPRILTRGLALAVICLVVARIVIQRRSGVPRVATGSSTAGYLITAAGCVFAALWLFPAIQTNLLLMAVIPLTLGVGEFFRWRTRSQNP